MNESSGSSDAVPRPVIEAVDLGIWYPRVSSQVAIADVLRHPSSLFTADRFWALRHLTLSLLPGQIVGVVGSNGAGKSTLCLALAGILPPSEGSIDVRAASAPLIRLGTGFHPELTGRQNALLCMTLLGMPRPQAREMLDEVIDFAELHDFIDEPLRVYSTGMRARLAFASTMIVQPEVLILDEVLAVGDIGFSGKCTRRIAEMMTTSKLAIIVSHSLAVLRGMCSHAIWLEAGRLQMFDDIRLVLREYQASAQRKSPQAPGARGGKASAPSVERSDKLGL